MAAHLQHLMKFLQHSPTVFHAAHETTMFLAENDFEPLTENEKWNLEAGKSYFVVRDQAAVIAFTLPKKNIHKALILASHLDSPALKVRPELSSPSDMGQLGVEIYGGPLLNSWLNVDLGIAGRILATNKQKKTHSKLVNIRDFPVIIPQLAIHMDREVNDKGLVLNKQEHLRPICSFTKTDLGRLLKKDYSFHELLAYDLFLYPLQAPSFVGLSHEMIASYRLDNLACAHAALVAIGDAKPQQEALQMAVFWDHEEIGSRTSLGAESRFLLDTLERIALACKMSRDEFLRVKNNSFCLSLDVAQGLNPNFSAKYDTQFSPKLGEGVILKYSAGQKYINSASAISAIVSLCEKEKLPLQKFVARNDIPSGSTVGPVMAANLGMMTLDMGIGLLAMHATREVISCKDQSDLVKLLKAVLSHPDYFQVDF